MWTHTHRNRHSAHSILQAAQHWSWKCSVKVDWLPPQWGSRGRLMLTLMDLLNTIHQSRTMGCESFSRSSCRGQIIRCCLSLNLQSCCHYYILNIGAESVFWQDYKSPLTLHHSFINISAFYKMIYEYFSGNALTAKEEKFFLLLLLF